MSIIFTSYTFEELPPRTIWTPIKGIYFPAPDGNWYPAKPGDKMYHNGTWVDVFAPSADDLIYRDVYLFGNPKYGTLKSYLFRWDATNQYYICDELGQLIYQNPNPDQGDTYDWLTRNLNSADASWSFSDGEWYNGELLPLHLTTSILTAENYFPKLEL